MLLISGLRVVLCYSLPPPVHIVPRSRHNDDLLFFFLLLMMASQSLLPVLPQDAPSLIRVDLITFFIQSRRLSGRREFAAAIVVYAFFFSPRYYYYIGYYDIILSWRTRAWHTLAKIRSDNSNATIRTPQQWSSYARHYTIYQGRATLSSYGASMCKL